MRLITPLNSKTFPKSSPLFSKINFLFDFPLVPRQTQLDSVCPWKLGKEDGEKTFLLSSKILMKFFEADVRC